MAKEKEIKEKKDDAVKISMHSKLDEAMHGTAKDLIEFFVGNNASYSELQRVRLIFLIFNIDNDMGQAILDAVENDWRNRKPEGGRDDEPYLDGLMYGLEIADEIDDFHRQRSRELQAAV